MFTTLSKPLRLYTRSLPLLQVGTKHAQTATSALKISVELESRIKANSSWGFSPQSGVTIYR